MQCTAGITLHAGLPMQTLGITLLRGKGQKRLKTLHPILQKAFEKLQEMKFYSLDIECCLFTQSLDISSLNVLIFTVQIYNGNLTTFNNDIFTAC